jgi:hypothetical protein
MTAMVGTASQFVADSAAWVVIVLAAFVAVLHLGGRIYDAATSRRDDAAT